MKIFPYRQKNGYRSILEAIDRNDARQHLKTYYGTGTRFCEIKNPDTSWLNWYSEDNFNDRVDNFLKNNRNFVT